jgi:predicted phosphodiesterase
MGKIKFLGDVHGKLSRIPTPQDGVAIVQIGDLGIGFGAQPQSYLAPTYRKNFFFIRGNHDNPHKCRQHPNYLGEFGMAPEELGKFFFVGGGFSIDRALRVEGRDWWPDEELSVPELQEAIDLYTLHKPRFMVTHEAPESVGRKLLTRINPRETYQPSRTAMALEAMRMAHMPEVWIHGHWHISVREKVDNKIFIGLDELEHCEFVV